MMPKSLYAIAGMGLAACVLLSLMMQSALKTRPPNPLPGLAEEIEDRFRGQLAGPVQVQEMEHSGRHTVRLRMKVVQGQQKRSLALSAGGITWGRALEKGRIPDSVLVQVSDEATGATEEFAVPQPPFFGHTDPVAAPPPAPPAAGRGG